jgi:hypothetical protein
MIMLASKALDHLVRFQPKTDKCRFVDSPPNIQYAASYKATSNAMTNWFEKSGGLVGGVQFSRIFLIQCMLNLTRERRL